MNYCVAPEQSILSATSASRDEARGVNSRVVRRVSSKYEVRGLHVPISALPVQIQSAELLPPTIEGHLADPDLPCSGSARPAHRLALVWRRSPQACTSSSAYRSSLIPKDITQVGQFQQSSLRGGKRHPCAAQGSVCPCKRDYTSAANWLSSKRRMGEGPKLEPLSSAVGLVDLRETNTSTTVQTRYSQISKRIPEQHAAGARAIALQTQYLFLDRRFSGRNRNAQHLLPIRRANRWTRRRTIGPYFTLAST